MNIKRIIREELEGFKDSNEEDWKWTEDVPVASPDVYDIHHKNIYKHEDIHGTELHVGDMVRVVNGDDYDGDVYEIERLLGLDDGWDEGYPELSYGHCGSSENGGCITTYDRGSLHFVGHEFELVEPANINESEGFLDSSKEDWEWAKEDDNTSTYQGYYVFDPPINENQWINVLGTLEKEIPDIRWSSGSKLTDETFLTKNFNDIVEIYGISIDTGGEGRGSNQLRTLSDQTWSKTRNQIYSDMTQSRLPTHDGREFFNIE